MSCILKRKSVNIGKYVRYYSGYDTTQMNALLNDECILVNDNDTIIGSASKKSCHEIIHYDNMLHRAFSVLLFSENNQLLVQQRSQYKILFPYVWTNTCCSHQIYSKNHSELGYNDIEDSDELLKLKVNGTKHACIDRLNFELGIRKNDIEMDDIQFVTRILYKKECDTLWGEHELDYILFIRKNVELNVNENEIKDVKYVDKLELESMMNDRNVMKSNQVMDHNINNFRDKFNLESL